MSNEGLETIVRLYLDRLVEVRSWDFEPCALCGEPKNNHRMRHVFQSMILPFERKAKLDELAMLESQLKLKSGWAAARVEKAVKR